MDKETYRKIWGESPPQDSPAGPEPRLPDPLSPRIGEGSRIDKLEGSIEDLRREIDTLIRRIDAMEAPKRTRAKRDD
ncbi:MAG: hypothetical protein ABR507_00445 [Actinomycetota bacterium]|nr:hypothetical protein [Actinomycetota bacterium]